MQWLAGKGYIPTSSLKDILKELDETLSAEDLDNIIGEIDTDGSGTVDFDGEQNTFNIHVPRFVPRLS